MKRRVNLLKTMLFAFVVLSLVGCKKEKITVSLYEIWFPEGANVQDIQITANCDWTISIDDDATWYTIRRSIDTTVYSAIGSLTYSIIDTTQVVSSGSGSMTLAVVVEPMEDALNRTSSFTITSAKGNIQVKVDVSQNTTQPAELQSITNMIFGVMNVAHWNVDYFGQVIEDSYR